MLYRLSPTDATWSGRQLAADLRHMSTPARAFMGHELWVGGIHLIEPTLAQVSALADVSVPYLRMAGVVANHPHRRSAVENGSLSLADAFRLVRPAPAPIDRVWSAAHADQKSAFIQAHADELWTAFDSITA
jgi:hypothetical protein